MAQEDCTPLYVAVDVGTGSARAGVFTAQGQKLGHGSQAITTRNVLADHYEQSSSEIWRAITASVREACSSLPADAHVAAIGIDATCSLVACADDDSFAPLSVVVDSDDPVGGDVYNVLLWLDRRAIGEAAHINCSTNEHVRLVRSHFGNSISPENEPPKLLWLLRNKPHVIRDGVFFDLSDWVAFKCCRRSETRSSCTVACKWGWGSATGEDGEGVWTREFWDELGLSILCENGFRKIGGEIVKPGQPMGKLCQEAAEALGLTTECVVASPMIDAHCGALWTLGADSSQVREIAPLLEQRISLICGTSTCFIELSKEPLFVDGVWGPFRDAILPGFSVTEGGQSVTGKLLENTVQRHPSYKAMCDRVGASMVYDELAEIGAALMRSGRPDPAEHIHCLDYHAGNRSPRADPSLKGAIVGISLSADEVDLAVKFRATVQALCYGARHIIEEMRKAGHDVRLITACGGLCRSRLFLRELADCVALPVVLSSEEDTVLLGGAILGRAAHILKDSAQTVGACIVRTASETVTVGEVIIPDRGRRDYHDRKYKVYHELHSDYQKYRRIMTSTP